MPTDPAATAPAGVPLVWRVFLLNATILLAACATLLFTPVTVSSPVALSEALSIVAGLLLMLVVDLVLLRRVFDPLHRLASRMRDVDLLLPGRVRSEEQGAGEVAVLARAFNEMVQRLEDERRAGAERAVLALEGERRRVSRELHDEVGQALTGLLLQLERAARGTGEPAADRIAEAQEAARSALQDVRRIAQQLRPEVLEDLGLPSALESLGAQIRRAADVRVECAAEHDLPDIGREAELVVYRVAQESLTNVARHARATAVELRLERSPGGVALTVRDDGIGVDGNAVRLTGGIHGMRERAMLVDAELTVAQAEAGGTLVRLEVPVAP
jgi:two-component system sensor histidine kinase UhpB